MSSPTPISPVNPLASLLTGLLEKNITKAGVIGGGLYLASQIALGIIHRSWDTIFSATGYAGMLLAIGGAAFRAKKTSDIMVASEAEKRIDPMTPHSPVSVVPAIQREIDKQLDVRASNGVPKP
jgi:hypothetical protein